MSRATDRRFISKIYNETLNFCKQKGLLYELRKSLDTSEDKRFSKLSIDKHGLSVLDAVHCLADKNRTLLLMEEISNQTNKDSIVIEAGVGTGILSFIASIKGLKVFGFEINTSVHKLSIKIRNHLIGRGVIGRNIIFTKNDARSIKLPIMADIIISENIYTGMFFEKQIDIVNVLKKFLKNDGHFIPSGMKSSFVLIEVDFIDRTKRNFLYICSETSLKLKHLSSRYIYDSIFFKKVDKVGVEYEKIIKASDSGTINSILICSDVLLPSGKIIGRYDTIFMNNDIFIKLKYPTKVEKGDMVSVKISYLYGTDPSKANISIKKL